MTDGRDWSPEIDGFNFRDALDVAAWAENDRLIGWKTWPEVWHLDDHALVHCYYKASSCSSLKAWAADPADLFRSREEGLQSPDGCTDRWFVVDSRPAEHAARPDEGDVEAFVLVRRALEPIGVLLLDAVVFDDDGHWWSMHELTTGSTRWPERRLADPLMSVTPPL